MDLNFTKEELAFRDEVRRLHAMGLANSTSFLRPMLAGTIHAEARPIHRGRTTWLWDVTCSDDDGRACAITRMTIAVRPPREG